VQLVLYGYEKVSSLQTSEELHLLAWNYNWDNSDAVEVMRHIINHPLCDQGTALLIYWYAGPCYVYARPDETARSDTADHALYALVEEIERNYLAAKFRYQSIRFDPQYDDGIDWTQDCTHARLRRRIPEAMFSASPGRPMPNQLLRN
jgi:hypothetical protein